MRTALVLLVIVLLAVVAGYLFVSGRGFSAREEPPAWEAAIAGRLRGLATPRAARRRANPIKVRADVLAEARAHYADHCAVCHGIDGSGQTEIGQGLYPRPPDLRAGSTQELADGELFYIIRNGVRFTGMPGFAEAPEEEDDESWHLVHLIRRLPQLTGAEREEIARLIPRSRAEDEEAAFERFLAGEDDDVELPGRPSPAPPHHH